VVCDSGSPVKDLVQGVAAETGMNMRYVHRSTDGFNAAATRNAGASVATGKWLLFLDGDCLPLPNVVRMHAARAGNCREVLVGGYVRIDKARSELLLAGRAARTDLMSLIQRDEFRALHWRHRKNRWYEAIRHPARPALHGGHFSLATTRLRSLNGFDESFGRKEDADFSQRVLRSGARTRSLWGGAVCLHIWHVKDRSAQTTSPEEARIPVPCRDRPVRCLQGLVDLRT